MRLIFLSAIFISFNVCFGLVRIHPDPTYFKLMMVQGVSSSKKTMVTRTDDDQAITSGLEVSFHTENVAIVCVAKTVTQTYTVWEVVDKESIIPFKKFDMVTMNKSKESIWELIPKQTKEHYLRYAWVVRGSAGLGIHEAVGQVSEDEAKRTQIEGDFLFDYTASEHLNLGLGFRWQREVSESEIITFESYRYILLGELTYHFPGRENIFDIHFYTGLTLGVGYSATLIDGDKQAGFVYVLPGTKFGLEHELSSNSAVILESSLDSLAIRELIDYRGEQNTNQVNLKLAIGYKAYF